MAPHGHVQREISKSAKLSEYQVQIIRRLKRRLPAKVVAERFGVSPTAIYEIWRGASWRWLPRGD